MCKKYVNVTTKCFKAVTSRDNRIVSYEIPFNGIKHNRRDNTIFLDKFSIVTNIDFLGTINEENKNENPLESNKTLDFIIRLTKCSKDNNKRMSYDLDEFSIDLKDLKDAEQINSACFDFINYTRITNVENLELPYGCGKYVIKILIKDEEEQDFYIQTMSSLEII